MDKSLQDSIQNKVDAYCNLLPLYQQYCEFLEKILTHIVKGISSEFIIKGKTKTVSSFVDEITLLKINYSDLVEQIPDLCSVIIIIPNLEELNALSKLIRKNFFIFEEKAKRQSKKTEISEFWHPFQNFFVQLKPELELYKKLDLKIPNELFHIMAEIQIRTFLQHSWEIHKYSKGYKRHFKVPKLFKRELNQIASLLEIADKSLNSLVKKLKDYESSYGAYMSNEIIKDEVARLEIVFKADKNNFDVAHKIAMMAMEIEDWDKAIQVLESILKNDYWKKHSDLKQSIILRDLGIALYHKHKDDPKSPGFKKGQDFLNAAIEKNPKDSDALSSLGGSYKISKDFTKAYDYYKKALRINPEEPYPLGNFLLMKIQKTGSLSSIRRRREMIQKGIERRLNHIKVKIDLPWAFFDVGTFSLFLDKSYESLSNYLYGIKFSPNIWMIDNILDSLDSIKEVHDQITDIKLVRNLLLLGMAFHPNRDQIYNQQIEHKILNKLSDEWEVKEKDLKEPIVIIAGGTDERIERYLHLYKHKFIKGFKNFNGTIISGGTKSGISGIVGDIQEEYPKTMRTIGYIPSNIPYNVEIDKRYSEIHATEGKDFSILETFQYWYDILNSGVDPRCVKLIGINGGKIAALEFRLAIIFGAQVGIIEDSYRAASELINDKMWSERRGKGKPKRLFKIIRNSSKDIHNFLTKPFTTDPDIENLRKILIQHINGVSIYEKDFSDMERDGDIMSGLLSAVQTFSKEIGFGEVPVLSAKEGSIIMTPFKEGDYRVIFFLFEEPSSFLEKKIIEFTQICEQELGDEIRQLQRIKMYNDESKMANILSRVFSSEILKFYE